MTSHPPHLELDDSLTLDGLLGSLGLIKKGKAGGKMGILPEMLLHGGEELCHRLLQLMRDVWEAGTVIQDWK